MYVVDELTRQALFKSGGADMIDLAGNYRMAQELESQGYQVIKRTAALQSYTGQQE